VADVQTEGEYGMEETMWRLSRNKILLAVLIVTAELMIFGFSDVSAQEKKRFSESNAAANTKYTQQHAIDVGDVAGHQIRIYELHYTWPSNPPVYEGIRAVEGWSRGESDYTNGNGRTVGYYIDVMENGDRIFSRYEGTSQAVQSADGAAKRTYHGVRTIVGGTGKFKGIRGTVRNTVIFDPKAGLNEGQGEGEYWIEK